MKYPTPAVTGVVLNPERRILLGRLKPGLTDAGKWCLPEGRLPGGLDWAHALVEILKSAAQIHIRDARLVGIYSEPSTCRRGDEHWLYASFLVTRFEGMPYAGGQYDELDWFPSNALPEGTLKSEAVKISDALAFLGEPFTR